MDKPEEDLYTPFCLWKRIWALINWIKGANARAVCYRLAESARVNYKNHIITSSIILQNCRTGWKRMEYRLYGIE